MRERYLEITFRKGKPIAAYLYLPRTSGQKSVRTEKAAHGMLIDYDDKGRPIGIEITAPQRITLEALNEILKRLNLPLVEDKDLAPLASV